MALEDIAKEVTVGFVGSMASEYVENGVPFLRSLNIDPFGINTNDLKFVSPEFHRKIKKSALRPGDVVIVRTGKPGTCAVVPDWLDDANCSDLVIARCGAKIRPRFLCYWINSAASHHISSHLVGAVQQHFNVGAAKKMLVATPSLWEQDQVISVLGSIDDRITLLRETNATLETIAQALFKSWFVDFDPVRAKAEGFEPEGMDAATAALFPDSFEESERGLVPQGWRGASLADLANFQNGYAFKSKDWVATGHPVVKIGDVKPGIIDLVGCSFVTPETTRGLDRFKLERGSLLVGMTGYVGETGLVPTVNPSAYLNQRVGCFSTANGLADLGFVYCLVRNPAFKIFAEAQSHGSAQANVSGTALVAYPVVIPSSDVLEQFNGVIAPVLESILSNHEQAQNLAQLRDTLLPRLISGQLRLPEAEVMVEDVCA